MVLAAIDDHRILSLLTAVEPPPWAIRHYVLVVVAAYIGVRRTSKGSPQQTA